MLGRRLPVPDGNGIYGFPADLLAAHQRWQQDLKELQQAEAVQAVELVAPLSTVRYLIEVRACRGRPVLAFEPHHDDLILSAGGCFLTQPRPLTVVTVFSRSNSVHPEVSSRFASTDEISTLRAAESQEAFRAFKAEHHLLGHPDADPPYRAYDLASVEQLAEKLSRLLDEHSDAELIAPAGVTRHPDHLLVHEAARRLGCRWFWDDTSFYPTYAANVDDRYLFELRTGGALKTTHQEITDVVLDKLTLLYMYESQMQPLREMYRVLRYNWTVAAKLSTENTGGAHFAERFHSPLTRST